MMLAVEGPLEIQLGYGAAQSRAVKSISVTMRTSGNDFELAADFLMTEGVVPDVNDIERIAHAAVGRVVPVDLSADVTVSLSNLERNFYTTSS